MEPRTDTAAEHTPSYPPKTPPPPKRPLSPPRPTTQAPPTTPLATTARRGVAMRNRRGVNWPMEAAPWTIAKARRRVLVQLQEWGHRPDEAVAAVITKLVGGVLEDGSRRISVHLSDQDGQACILALSHQPALTAGQPPAGDDVLAAVGAIPIVSSCGTDTAPDGRRLWAVIDL
ncbi:hypothetical protein [Streptomyces sp. Wb2n-11]|uniref:hypothetical protein n=1 Tax=Streptomyces sp. Wb2n-11 TaxID=1030533 RepID=UPI000AE69AE3|nr:hypothetical protein [Streptomyces sp. Wb2n-11]